MMEERNAIIPIWPAGDGDGARRMSFLCAEARWYLWFQEENKQAILNLRRDLLLLHQNGDLEQFKDKESLLGGTYLTSLHEGRMIRGRICASQKTPDDGKKRSKFISVIDIDEGKIIELPLNQIRVLPIDMRSLPCQSIRCDVGLDCVEQFEWPTEINNMLHKALDKFFLYVENSSNRPGSIPTISAKVTIIDPSSGKSLNIQAWLMEKFSYHLDLCSFEKFKPFPVGMSADLLEKNMGILQRKALGLGSMTVSEAPSSQLCLSPSKSPTTVGRSAPSSYNQIHPHNVPSSMPPILPPHGMLPHGMPPYGMPPHGMPPYAMPPHGIPSHGMPPHGMTPQGMPPRMHGNMPPASYPNMLPSMFGGMPPMPPNMHPGMPPPLSNIMHHSSPLAMMGAPIMMQPSMMSSPNFMPHMASQVPAPRPESTVRATTMVSFQYSHSAASKSSSSVSLKSQSIAATPQLSLTEEKQPSKSRTRTPSEDVFPMKEIGSNTSSSSLNHSPSAIYESDVSNATQSTVAVDVCATRERSSSNTSNSSVGFSSSVIFESDEAKASQSSVAVDLSGAAKSLLRDVSSSSSGLNPYVASYVPNVHGKTNGQSAMSIERDPCLEPRGQGNRRENPTSITSSSELSVEAEPFVPTLGSNKFGHQKMESSPTSRLTELSVEAAQFVPKLGVNGITPKKKEGSASSHFIQDGPSSNFPTGRDVELVSLRRIWKVGEVLSAVIGKVWNPSCFEVNVVDEFCELMIRIQDEMTEFYESHRVTISSKKQAQDLCGSYCACYDADQETWFRAEVEEYYRDDSVVPLKVWKVDDGGFARVDISCIQPLATKLACTSPILITMCSMKNIMPQLGSDIWPEAHLNRVKQLLPEEKQVFLRIDGPKSKEEVWPVSVFIDASCSRESINELLVAEGCALYVGYVPEISVSSVPVDEMYEDSEDPMEEAYKIGGNDYELDDEDACVAVSGRKPTDEVGICWFYNTHGHCYKKFCDLKHVRLDPEGHSIEKLDLHSSAFEEIDDSILTPGAQLKLTVTRILTVNHFIATVHFRKGSNGIQSRETLKSVLDNLNSPQMKRELKAFTEYPGDGEIVLFRDKDKSFYRGRIVGSDLANNDLFDVLNVDTGYKSKVLLQDLRRVDPAFLHHPFQAMECWLADVAPTQTDREWVKICNGILADLVRGKKLVATVIRSAPWGIEVNLYDKNGQDLAVALKEQGVVKSCPMRHLPVTHSPKLPG